MNMNASYIAAYLEFARGKGLAASTLRRYRYFLQRFVTWLDTTDIREVNSAVLQAYREYVGTLVNQRGNRVTETTIESQFITLRELFRYLHRSNLLLKNPMEDLPQAALPGKNERAIFSEADITTFLDSIPTDSPEGLRDRAFFELMYSSGLRNQEARLLKLDDLNVTDRIIRVTGKGNRDRYVPVSVPAGRFLSRYLNRGRKQLQKGLPEKDRQYVFLSRHSGVVSWKVMRTRFLRYLAECGLSEKGYTIHGIRHATATHLLTAGAGIRYVQELMGHRSLKTTQIYTRPTTDNIKAVYRTYHPRENTYWREIDTDYRGALAQLVGEREENSKEHQAKRRRKQVR